MHKALSTRRRLERSVCAAIASLTLGASMFVGLASVGGSGDATAGAATTALAAGKANCPSGTAPGITANQVNAAATIIDINSGNLTNTTVGVPSVQTQEAYWNEVAKKINSEGGAGCRKVAMSFYTVNPLSAADAQQSCLTIANAKPYIVFDSGALTDVGASDCIPQHHILLSSSYLSPANLTADHPYALDIGENPNQAYQTGIKALKSSGAFSSAKGFKKLGVLYHTCASGAVSIEKSSLAAAKVPSNDVVYFNLGCPAGQADSSASMEQAVLSFKNAGVTHVTEIGVNDFGLFSQVAAQQHYSPHYVFTDGTIATSGFTGPDAPDPTNFNGAVDIVESSTGEPTTPGYTPSGATKACDSIYKAAGEQPLYKQPDGYGGFVCSYLDFLQALLNHASTVSPTAQISSMHKIGLLDLPYPAAPTNFSAAPIGSATGVSEWRTVVYHSSCKCWQIPNPTFHTS